MTVATTGGNPIQLATGATDDYLIGGGTLYFYPVTSSMTTFPTDAEIEQSQYNVGVCSKGFKITDKPKIEEITDSNQNLIRQFVTQEKLTIKTGVVSWKVQNLSTLSRATYSTNCTTNGAVAGEQVATVTGSGQLPIYLVRLVNNSLPNGQTIRFTCIAQPGAGFDLSFSDKPTTVNAEMSAIYYIKGFLANVRQAPGVIPTNPVQSGTPSTSPSTT